jgi:alkaline phosphatase D
MVSWYGAHTPPVTSSSPFGNFISPEDADKISDVLVSEPLNADLQWSEGSYRGFFTLTIDPNKVNATYWAMDNTSTIFRLI